MTTEAKLAQVKTFLGISDTSEDALLTAYLASAKDEILAWVYSYTEDYNSDEPTITDVPKELEQIQIHAVVSGFGIRGAEGQTSHGENGISRAFKYDDMISYIHNKCIPKAGVL